MIKYYCEQRSEEWFALRRGKVTSTGFKDLMSKKDTASYNNLLYNIVTALIDNEYEDEESFVSKDMENGIELEPIAACCYEDIFETELEQVGFITPNKTHTYYNLIGISPDRLTKDNGLVEIKCPKNTTHLKYIENDKLPTEYRWQVQGQLYVTGLDYCDFMSFHPSLKPFIKRVTPCKEDFIKIEEELKILKQAINEKIEIYHRYDYLK